MRRVGKIPVDVKIVAETHEDNPFPPLGNTVICAFTTCVTTR